MKLDNFLNPKSIAVVGATRNKNKLGWQIMNNIRVNGYTGKIYPVNLSKKTIYGLPAYRNVQDIEGIIDLAVIVIPAQGVVSVVKDCALKGVKNVVIISAGFSESGVEGGIMEDKIKEIAYKYNLNILGPNCLGIISSVQKVNATFAGSRIKKGKVAFLSQSGAIGSAALDWIQNKDLGFSYFISLGNKSVLDENDFFEFFTKDKETDLVVAYLEEIKNGTRFMEVVTQLSKVKPVVILKSGKSLLGSEAAMSHTGSLAGSNEAVLAGFRRTNVISVDSIEEIFHLIRFFENRNRRIANSDMFMVSNAGGPMVATVDQISMYDLELGEFNLDLTKKIKKQIPVLKVVKNPFDIIGDADADRYKKALGLIMSNAKVYNMLVLLTPQTTTEVAETAKTIVGLNKKYPNKNICTSFIGGEAVGEGKEILEKGGVVDFDFPSQAIRCFSRYIKYVKGLKSLKPYKGATNKKKKMACSMSQLDYIESFKVLKQYNIPVVDTISLRRESDYKKMKYPAAMKVVGPNLIHKTDKNSIALNIKNQSEAVEVKKSFAKLLKNEDNYCVSQKMVESGFEMILGFKRDTSFGPVIMVGAGGIYTEIFKDVQTEVDDVNSKRALEMLKQLKMYPILVGARGQKGYDIKSLIAVIVNLVRLARENPQIEELDINPLFALRNGVVAADVRVIV